LEENISINGIFLTKFLHVNSKSEKTSEFRPPIRRHLCNCLFETYSTVGTGLSYKTNVYCGYSPIGFIYWCTKTGFLVITAPQGGGDAAKPRGEEVVQTSQTTSARSLKTHLPLELAVSCV
jgi:hypothetical protein